MDELVEWLRARIAELRAAAQARAANPPYTTQYLSDGSSRVLPVRSSWPRCRLARLWPMGMIKRYSDLAR